jgi:hypothetical protein
MANLGSAASGAMSGAGIGSTFGPVGTAVGAIGGGILGLFGGGQKKQKPKKISTLDESQQRIYDQLVQALGGQGEFAGLYNYDEAGANEAFDKNVARPGYRKFEENIIPGITGQFRGKNLMNSSYTGEALGRAGRDVQENLDALRSQMHYNEGKEARQNKMQGIRDVLGTKTFDYLMPQEGGGGGIDGLLSALAPIGGDWFKDFLKSKSGGGGGGVPNLANAGNFAGTAG